MYIQWRCEGGEWQNLVALTDISGPAGQNGVAGQNGKTPEFRVDEAMLQWRYVGDEVWLNLYDISTLKGLDGTAGQSGADGKDGNTPFIGENGSWWIGDTDTGIKAAGEKGEKGEKGDKGDTGAPGKDGKDGSCAGYFSAHGESYSWGKLPFNVKKESGGLISYNNSDSTITLSKDHTYSLVFSGTVEVNASGDDRTCIVYLVDGYSSDIALDTQISTIIPKDRQIARLTMAYNTIYTAEENIVLTFQYTTMMPMYTNFGGSRYNITIIALD